MIVRIETDRGTWVQALLAAGYQVYVINPRQKARFKERYGTSGAKSDAHALAKWSAEGREFSGQLPCA